jgi:ketopantoate reductase
MVGNNSSTRSAADPEDVAVVRVTDQLAQVAKALGQRVEPALTTIQLELLIAANSPDTTWWQEAVRLLKAAGGKRVAIRDNVSSLLQDLQCGRRTEGRQLNGVIAELGRSVGVETPLNGLRVRTVLAIEAGRLRSGTEGLSQVTRELEATYA